MKEAVSESLGPLTIQSMETKDLDEAVSIAASSRLTRWTHEMFAGEMKNPYSHCFVGKIEGASAEGVVGFICFRAIGDESELLNLCVHPGYRRQFVGKRLMKFYLDFSRTKGVKAFHLDVDPSNEPALRLYRSFCYEPSGRRKNFYGGNSDALLMTRRET